MQLEIIYGRHLPTAIKTAFKIIKNLVEKMRKVTLWLKFRRWTKHWDFDYIWFEKKSDGCGIWTYCCSAAFKFLVIWQATVALIENVKKEFCWRNYALHSGWFIFSTTSFYQIYLTHFNSLDWKTWMGDAESI